MIEIYLHNALPTGEKPHASSQFHARARRPRARHDQTDPTEANNNNNNSKRPAMIRANSVRTTFAIAIAIASLASVALAQDPCTCKEPCAWVLGANICYVAGGTSCSWATKSMLRWWTNDA